MRDNVKSFQKNPIPLHRTFQLLALLMMFTLGADSASATDSSPAGKRNEWQLIGHSPIGDDIYVHLPQSRRHPTSPEQVYVVFLLNLACRHDCLKEKGWASTILHNSYICGVNGDDRYASWESKTHALPFGEGEVLGEQPRRDRPDILPLARGMPSAIVRDWACKNLPAGSENE